jgi:uncharacterized membrane protein YjjP (DUF1212 family)
VLTAENQPSPTPASAAVDPFAVLQLAMRIGDALLSAGMSANDVVLFALRIAEAYGLSGVHVDVTYTSMSASYHPAPGVPPVTAMRVVRPTEVDYTRVRRLLRLATRIERGMPVSEAAAALDQIRSAEHPYPRWIAMLGGAGVGPAASLLFNAPWKILLLTFLTGCLVYLLITTFDRRRVPPFFRQMFAAAVITLAAAGISYAASHGVTFFVRLDPTTQVVGGIVMLLAGVMIVGAVQDAIDQFYVTASARVLEVFMRTGGIVVGIWAGLALARGLNVPLTISAETVLKAPLGVQFGAVAAIATCFAVSVYADFVTVLLSATMALVGWAAFVGAKSLVHSDIPADAVAALVGAVVTTLIVRRTHMPGFGLITAALLALTPGLPLYQGLLQLVGTEPGSADADPTAGGNALLHALGVAVAIGAGASLGTFFGRPIVDTVRRITFWRRTAEAPD